MNKKKLAKAVLKDARKLKKDTKKLKAFKKAQKLAKQRGKKPSAGRAVLKVFGKLFAILAAIYAVLFSVFFFDLDGKLLYYVVEPFLVKHYDRMERKNPLDVPYDIKK